MYGLATIDGNLRYILVLDVRPGVKATRHQPASHHWRSLLASGQVLPTKCNIHTCQGEGFVNSGTLDSSINSDFSSLVHILVRHATTDVSLRLPIRDQRTTGARRSIPFSRGSSWDFLGASPHAFSRVNHFHNLHNLPRVSVSFSLYRSHWSPVCKHWTFRSTSQPRIKGALRSPAESQRCQAAGPDWTGSPDDNGFLSPRSVPRHGLVSPVLCRHL